MPLKSNSDIFVRTTVFLLPVALLITFFVWDQSMHVFYEWPRPGGELLFVPGLCIIVAAVYFLIRWRLESVASCLFALFVCWLVFFEVHFNGTVAEYLEQAKFYIYTERYQACANSAIDVGNGQRFGLCERHVFDNVGEAIVYDSSDQIILGQRLAARNPAVMERFSHAWTQAYRHFGLPDLNGDYGYDVFLVVKHDHFYKFIWG